MLHNRITSAELDLNNVRFDVERISVGLYVFTIHMCESVHFGSRNALLFSSVIALKTQPREEFDATSAWMYLRERESTPSNFMRHPQLSSTLTNYKWSNVP